MSTVKYFSVKQKHIDRLGEARELPCIYSIPGVKLTVVSQGFTTCDESKGSMVSCINHSLNGSTSVCVCVCAHYADTDAVRTVRGKQLAEYAWGCSASLLFDDTESNQLCTVLFICMLLKALLLHSNIRANSKQKALQVHSRCKHTWKEKIIIVKGNLALPW